MKCEDCCHAEMCKWIDELEGRGCDFLSQEPCDDAISREAVIKGIEELKKSPWATANRSHGYEYLITEALDVVKDLCVKALPSVTQKSGKWIEHDVFDPLEHGVDRLQVARCSKCELYHTTPYLYSIKHFNYCPNCGAKMVEPQESEEISERNMKMWEEIFKAERR